jgi:tripartite-type tricarboxylate transporter receptor subunit TctC
MPQKRVLSRGVALSGNLYGCQIFAEEKDTVSLHCFRVLASVLGLSIMGFVPGAYAQDDFPSKPVQVIVPFPPGGVADLNARPMAEVLTRLLKHPFIVINRSGAGGALGYTQVATAKPDGYTLLAALASMVTIPPAERLSGKEPSYQLDQFVPIALVSSDPMMFIVRTDSPIKTIQDLFTDAKNRPGKLSYGSSGIYGNIHVATEMVAHAVGLNFLHVPYTGGGPANTALLGGQVDFTLAGPSSAGAFIRGGKARPLAATGAKRLAAFPDVPTLKELGYDVEFNIWCGLFAPAGTPAPIIQKLRDAMRQVANDGTFKSTMDKLMTPITYLDSPDFQRLYDSDAKRLEGTIKRIGLQEQTK